MREVTFLRRNAGKWKQYEKSLENPQEPDVQAVMFVELTDDLAYAQTHYPKSATVDYLNDLTSRVHQEIYKNQKEERGRFMKFWAEELPLVYARYQKQILYSFIIFMVSVAIGAFSQLNDVRFVRSILGDQYVNMTMENIEKGDPLAVYGRSSQLTMFSYITFHNVMVALRTFALGLLLSVGTFLSLMFNGVMVGCFVTMFAQKDLLLDAMLVIFIHGTLELWAIVVAGAAGLAMGNSILFPKTYSRLQSFQRGAIDGLKMVIGLVPVFFAAGFLESFVTRYTNMPLLLSLIIIGGSATWVVYYYLVLPRKLARRFSGEG